MITLIIKFLFSFLGIVSSPDVVRTATAVANEMSQLEDTRRFHLCIYDKVWTFACKWGKNLIPLFFWLMHWGIFLFIQQNPDHAGDATAGMYTYLVIIMPIKLKLRLWDVKWIQVIMPLILIVSNLNLLLFIPLCVLQFSVLLLCLCEFIIHNISKFDFKKLLSWFTDFFS